ncbi:O-acetyltransferase OatA [Acaryochloris thomasi RCC1774]|uniref:O-acetyltransferase OatA n=1 Tax=Acaryochloris thomasi RCC1774 TaxID=1764569 RepID=A0A2W1JTU9_9CYAN|nr:acyltransferase family protein [Acaryochloris thomasi]PZD74475.1 O-acetyltransferase OatA [Acaryochloris thomasi RCC1774]
MNHSVKNSASKKTTYIRGIDGLRALAVLAVIIFHISPAYLPGGFSGVDIFFVISGYVVCGSLIRHSTLNFSDFIVSFYSRRVKRIFPPLLVCLVLVSIFSILFVPASPIARANTNVALSAFLGISNFSLAWNSNAYFSPGTELNPFSHTWSLGIEEQFYVIFPLLFFVWAKHKKRSDIFGVIVNFLLPALLGISLAYSAYETSASPDNAFYLLPSRFWELSCGALLFDLHSRNILIPQSSKAKNLCLLIGIALAGGAFFFSDSTLFPFPWALPSVLGTLFLISGILDGVCQKPIIQRLLEDGRMVDIGKKSYSLYLWHWPIFVFFRWTVGFESAITIASATVLTFLLANISYYYVEIPARKNKYAASLPNWKMVVAGIVTVALSYGFTRLAFRGQKYLSFSVVSQNQDVWNPYSSYTGQINNEDKGFNNRKLFVLGDSHAGAYRPMLRQLSKDQGVDVHIYQKGGCGFSLRKPALSGERSCSLHIEDALSTIETLASPGDILFLAALKIDRIGSNFHGPLPIEDVMAEQSEKKAISDRETALTEAKEIVKKFSDLSMTVVIDAPKPVFSSPPFRCSDWFNASNPVCSSAFTTERDFLLGYRKPVMDKLNKLASHSSNVFIWDPFPILCKADECSAFDGNQPLFYDGDHLSSYGSRALYPSFLSVLEKIWLPSQRS